MKRNINPRKIRHKRLRAKIKGTTERPRLSVFKSNSYVYGQLVDDTNGRTMVAFSELELVSKNKDKEKLKKTERAKHVGMEIAKRALEKKIELVVFDRGGYKYQGRIKSLADGAREGGLNF